MQIMKTLILLASLFVMIYSENGNQEQQNNIGIQSSVTSSEDKTSIKRGTGNLEQTHGGYQTGFTPIFTNNYAPVGHIQYAQPSPAAATPQIYVTRLPPPHAAFSTLQLASVAPKIAYSGPQIAYTPQPAKVDYIQPQVVYPQLQYQYAQPQPQVQQYQQPQQTQSVPHVGPLAYQNSYAFVPMNAISLNYHNQPVTQNHGILTHTQAYPISSNQQHQHVASTHPGSIGNVQLVYPNFVSTVAPKPIAPLYATYQNNAAYQQPHYIQQSQPQHIQAQPLQQLTYAIQPQVQLSSNKQLIAPTVSTLQYKPLVAAQTTQTSHGHNGAVSYSSIQQHLGHATPVTPLKLNNVQQQQPQYYSPQIYQQPKVLQYAAQAPQQLAQGSSSAIYTQHGAVHYGSHLYNPDVYKQGYSVPQKVAYTSIH